MSKRGADAVLSFVTKKIVEEIKKILSDAGKFACAKIDQIIAKLKHAGCAVPNMSGWSCDQKIAFVATLGEFGAASVIAGELVGTLANDTKHEFDKYSSKASKAAQAILVRSGVDAAADAVSSAATSIGHKLGL